MKRLLVFFITIYPAFLRSQECQEGIYKQELRLWQECSDLRPERFNHWTQIKKIFRSVCTMDGDALIKALFFARDIPITRQNMPCLVEYVDALCDQEGIAKPHIFLDITHSTLNARAIYLSERQSAIVIHCSLIETVSDDELEAVVAHELGHLRARHSTKIFALLGLVVYPLLYFIDNFLRPHYLVEYQRCHPYLFAYHCTAFYVYIVRYLPPILVNKRFEREADQFACDVGKAEGLIAFMQRIKEAEIAQDELLRSPVDIAPEGKVSWLRQSRSFFQRGCRRALQLMQKLDRWLYCETRLGWHPSPDSRIEAARRAALVQHAKVPGDCPQFSR